MSVAKCAEADWQISFKRMLDPKGYKDWRTLQDWLKETQLNDMKDEVLWGLSPSKKFTTRSLYNFLTNGGISYKMAKRIWKCRVPLKIRIFL
jgi:hypothetical protein